MFRVMINSSFNLSLLVYFSKRDQRLNLLEECCCSCCPASRNKELCFVVVIRFEAHSLANATCLPVSSVLWLFLFSKKSREGLLSLELNSLSQRLSFLEVPFVMLFFLCLEMKTHKKWMQRIKWRKRSEAKLNNKQERRSLLVRVVSFILEKTQQYEEVILQVLQSCLTKSVS